MCSVVSPADTPRRRATDLGEPTNREILDRLEDFIAEHRRDHATLETRLSLHDLDSARREMSLEQLKPLVPEVQVLHDFRTEVRTIGTMTRYILGGSLLAAVAAIASLVATFGHIIQTGP